MASQHANGRMVLSEALGLAPEPEIRGLKVPGSLSRSRCESRSTSADSSPEKSSTEGTPRLPTCIAAPPGLEDFGSPASSTALGSVEECPFAMPPGLEGLLDFMYDGESQLPPPPSHEPVLKSTGRPGPISAPPAVPAPPVHEAPVFCEKELAPPPPISPGAAGIPPPPSGWAFAVAPPPLQRAPILEVSPLPPPPPSAPAGTVPPPGLHTAASPAALSVGSAGHFAGACKPCAFVHNKGCGNGAQCPFCHLCPPGEKQRRKNVRKQLARMGGPAQHEQLEWGAR